MQKEFIKFPIPTISSFVLSILYNPKLVIVARLSIYSCTLILNQDNPILSKYASNLVEISER